MKTVLSSPTLVLICCQAVTTIVIILPLVLICLANESRTTAIVVAVLFGLYLGCLITLVKDPQARYDAKLGYQLPPDQQKESPSANGPKHPFYWMLIVDGIIL